MCNLLVLVLMPGQYSNESDSRERLNPAPPDDLLFGRSRAMAEIRARAEKICRTNIPILLCGEGGTGKEALARWIHRNSEYRTGEFVKVNCAAICGSLLESELFGYEKGAFTGAEQSKPGRVELAHGGTLFLDEIAELDVNLQVKLLHFLQHGTYSRLGDHSERKVNARVLSATNKDLMQENLAGRFRPDFFYRIQGFQLKMPALRERSEDIVPLAEMFLAQAAARNRRTGLQFSDEARKALVAYSWPGNIRELRNAVERAVVLSRGAALRREDLPDILFHSNAPRNGNLPEEMTLEQIEQEHIRRVLALAPTLEDAAANLGICVATLWRKRKRYHFD